MFRYTSAVKKEKLITY